MNAGDEGTVLNIRNAALTNNYYRKDHNNYHNKEGYNNYNDRGRNYNSKAYDHNYHQTEC